eukprot:jgi/Picre1/27789/NNA_000753.t1
MDQIVERMFCMSDTDGDGCLSEKEFVELVRVVNPESNLEQEHVDLIVEQVWNEFGVEGGLRMEDLKKIYQSGVADVKRDYDLMIKAYRGRKSEEEMCVQNLLCLFHRGLGIQVTLQRPSRDVLWRFRVFAKDAVKADEMEYFKAVLGVEPEQAFSESDFGEDVSVLFLRERLLCGKIVPRLPLHYRCLLKANGCKDMMVPSESVPRGLLPWWTKDDCLAGDGKHRHVTIACRVPTEKGRIANDLVKSLKNNPHIVFPGVGDVDVIAVQDPERRDSKLMYTLSFAEKGMGGKALFDQGMVVAQDLEPLLPPGSSVHVYESDDRRSTVSLVVNIPKEYGVKEVDSYKDAPRQLHQWCSVANKVAPISEEKSFHLGSSGLVEALNDVHIDAAEGPAPRSAELSPDKDAGNISTVISVHAFPSAALDDKDTAVEDKKPKGGDGKIFSSRCLLRRREKKRRRRRSGR